MSAYSNYFGNQVLTQFFNTTRYVALFTADPTVSFVQSAEVTGGSYVRQGITFTVPSNRSVANAVAAVFDNMPACTLTHIGVCDAAVGGNLLLYTTVTPNMVVVNSARYTIAVNELVLTLS